jgi:hypothetical protein
MHQAFSTAETGLYGLDAAGGYIGTIICRGIVCERKFMANAYRDDLAYIHDVGYGDFVRNAAPALLDMLRQHGIDRGLVIDLG